MSAGSFRVRPQWDQNTGGETRGCTSVCSRGCLREKEGDRVARGESERPFDSDNTKERGRVDLETDECTGGQNPTAIRNESSMGKGGAGGEPCVIHNTSKLNGGKGEHVLTNWQKGEKVLAGKGTALFF